LRGFYNDEVSATPVPAFVCARLTASRDPTFLSARRNADCDGVSARLGAVILNSVLGSKKVLGGMVIVMVCAVAGWDESDSWLRRGANVSRFVGSFAHVTFQLHVTSVAAVV
jgi:hypothetical protein